MNQLTTKAIVLSRTNYGEADRIVTWLSPNDGKLCLMAKGARRIKSKLVGGIELFSISDLTYLNGRGSIGTLISARLDKHYHNIIQDIDRVQLGYEILKKINKITEEQPEKSYFVLLENSFTALNDLTIENNLIRVWFYAQTLKIAGHTPNLSYDVNKNRLLSNAKYNFDPQQMTFRLNLDGQFAANHIKLIRLLFSAAKPKQLSKIHNINQLLDASSPIMRIFNSFILSSK